MNNKISKTAIIAGVIVILIVAIAGAGISAYNGMVSGEENVRQAWSQVENQYQRRSDLIPNLVNTVKGYAKHEQQTLTQVIEARSKATSTTVNFDQLDSETFAQYQAAQGQLTQALGRLMVVAERYPELKANENFRDLQSQLEGTENRISTERRRYNEAVQSYNMSIRKFPRNIFAGMFGFDQKEYFKAQDGAETAPVVEF